MPRYDRDHFEPPAAVALVSVKNPKTNAHVESFPMLLDTGADISVLPPGLAASLALEVQAGHAIETEGYDGRRSTLRVVSATLEFERIIFNAEFVLLDHDQPAGILGRNILNLLHLQLNGPANEWDVLVPAPRK